VDNHEKLVMLAFFGLF